MNKTELLDIDQVKRAIKFETPARPPRCSMLWHNQETLDYYKGDFEKLIKEYPDDILAVHIGINYWESDKADESNYRWAYTGQKKPEHAAIDNCPIISDWDTELKKFLDDMPNPNRPDAMDPVITARNNDPDRYILANWGHYFHQRLTYIRGTENMFYDYYDNPECLKTVLQALLDFYKVWAKRTAEAGGNGVWAGDDLGTQRSLFMHPDVFRDIYKPFYKALADVLHENGLDFWLHTCGNVYEILEDIVETGVDVIHPIQVGAMDAEKTVQNYVGRIAFWAGMDVQKLIPFGTPEQVEEGIIERATIFYNPQGGVIYGAGNSLMAGIPFENIETYAKTLTEFCFSPDRLKTQIISE